MALAIPLALALPLLAACGGGGGGSGSPGTPVADTQTLPTARAVLDVARATAFLAADVQNIIVFAPVLVARGDFDEACDQGGTLQTRVLRPDTDPDGPLVRQVFSDCRSGGLRLQGQTEINYTRRTSDGPEQPWAGSVRFTAYAIGSTEASQRQRRYDGLAQASGSLGIGSLTQSRTMQLSNFTFSDSPDTLGRGGLITTTAGLTLQRTPGALGDPLTLAGSWVQEGGPLRVAVTLDAGSRISLVENVAGDIARGSIGWADSTVPAFSGRFVLQPSGRTALRVELDLGADGSVDRNRVLDRTADIGLSL